MNMKMLHDKPNDRNALVFDQPTVAMLHFEQHIQPSISCISQHS